MDYRCGFVGLVGPTNSGKSTLLNALAGQKLSIVSPLPQTTYHSINAIVTGSDYQVIFTDTPGFQSHPDRVPQILNKVASRKADDCDLLVWVFDASSKDILPKFNRLKSKIEKYKERDNRICVLNKIDLIKKSKVLPIIDCFSKTDLFSEIIPISAEKKDGVSLVFDACVSRLPLGPRLYSSDDKTDRSLGFRVKELVREKIYRVTRQEVPYSVYLETEDDGEVDLTAKIPIIHVVINVDSDSRKAILIGKGGRNLKTIGHDARLDLERILGRQVCLKLFVRVEDQWKNDANKLSRYLELQ